MWSTTFLALVSIELLLGVDNLIFLTTEANKLPDPKQQFWVRVIGLLLAMVARAVFLSGLLDFLQITTPLFFIAATAFCVHTLLLLAGGVFLVIKSVSELLEDSNEVSPDSAVSSNLFFTVLLRIVIMDIILSLDSMITAVGLTSQLPIMMTAIAVSIIFMFFASAQLSRFIEKYPTIKRPALIFLGLVGCSLCLNAFNIFIPVSFLYVISATLFCYEIHNINRQAILSTASPHDSNLRNLLSRFGLTSTSSAVVANHSPQSAESFDAISNSSHQPSELKP